MNPSMDVSYTSLPMSLALANEMEAKIMLLLLNRASRNHVMFLTCSLSLGKKTSNVWHRDCHNSLDEEDTQPTYNRYAM